MSSRRARVLISNEYTTTLKTGTKRRSCKITGSEWNVFITKQRFRPINPESYSPKAWAKFDSTDFDGIHLICGLYNKGFLTPSGSCTFRVYSVSLTDSWQETLLTTQTGVVMSDGRFKVDVPLASLTPLDPDGEQTILIQVDVTRQGISYTERFYFNHIGSYEFLTRLKNKVTFLELTKADE